MGNEYAPLVSLCIPTNGVVSWVFPVLDSIYMQHVDEQLFEVIITDNGDNDEFKHLVKQYLCEHNNIVYAETKALPFLNEIEAYKRSSGELIKFVNHRTKLIMGSLDMMLDYVRKNRDLKPITYFTNGELEIDKKIHFFSDFDHFVRNLSFWSSWSTGMTIWKSDFEKLSCNVNGYNELFPHTDILFNERKRKTYVIDNSIIFDTIPQGKKPKGSYDLFYAFGIEYPSIILKLFRDKDITFETYQYVMDKNLENVARLYWYFCIKKQYCSYDLSGIDVMYQIFYSKRLLRRKIIKLGMKKIIHKLSIGK